MMIQVSPDNIRKGKRCDSSLCPVALAVREQFPNKMVTVGLQILIGCTGYRLTKRVRKIVADYDSLQDMKPFKFRLMEHKHDDPSICR
jgi:hypothetical protein